MGDLSRMNAAGRYRDAVRQRLDDGEEPEDILWEVIGHLERSAMDSMEIDRMTREMALNEGEIDFPD